MCIFTGSDPLVETLDLVHGLYHGPSGEVRHQVPFLGLDRREQLRESFPGTTKCVATLAQMAYITMQLAVGQLAAHRFPREPTKDVALQNPEVRPEYRYRLWSVVRACWPRYGF